MRRLLDKNVVAGRWGALLAFLGAYDFCIRDVTSASREGDGIIDDAVGQKCRQYIARSVLCYWAAHAELKILHRNAQDGLLCQGRDKAISIYAQESISIIGLLHELLFMHLYPRLSHQVYAHYGLKGP
jgi:hypothetical protein